MNYIVKQVESELEQRIKVFHNLDDNYTVISNFSSNYYMNCTS